MDPWTKHLLSLIVSRLCKTMGWHSISSSSMNVLVDVLDKYLKQLGDNLNDYTQLFNHTQPSMPEMGLTFRDLGINPDELEDYIKNVSPISLKIKTPHYPLEKESHLNFLKPGSREVVTRPMHVDDHLPAMYPEPDDGYYSQESVSDELYGRTDKPTTKSISQEFGRPCRQLKSVAMTSSGFLSVYTEGKLAEAKLPPQYRKPMKLNTRPPKKSEPEERTKKLANTKEMAMFKAFKPKVSEPLNDRPASPRLPKMRDKPREKELAMLEKMPTESNKQKLNIFKRPNKIKEDVKLEKREAHNAQTCIVDGLVNYDEGSIVKIKKPPKKSPPLPKPKRKKAMDEPTMVIPKKPKHEEEPEKIIEKTIAKELQPPESPIYPFLSHLTPGMISPSLSQNPLFPRFPLPFPMTKLDRNSPHPEMPNLPLPPSTLMQAHIEPTISAPPDEEPKPTVPILSEKKLKKKMKKDKKERDRKRRDKKELKSKQKSEKKKDKGLKKQKLKNRDKLLLKKETKLAMPNEEPVDDPSVPKLLLKLAGPHSPQPEPVSPKIVIKPIVKREEVAREPSPELAKISALVMTKPSRPTPKSLPSPEMIIPPVEPIPQPAPPPPPKVKKVKEKPKKKAEDVKPKPEPFYYDADGNQVWVCPACGAQDDGSPMIGCDGCDAWYHWVCVGIKSAPDSAKWFCGTCAKTK